MYASIATHNEQCELLQSRIAELEKQKQYVTPSCARCNADFRIAQTEAAELAREMYELVPAPPCERNLPRSLI